MTRDHVSIVSFSWKRRQEEKWKISCLNKKLPEAQAAVRPSVCLMLLSEYLSESSSLNIGPSPTASLPYFPSSLLLCLLLLFSCSPLLLP